ncbi:unnamed protein product [Dicrocoelium dendriticum]|nr:unnamed protein product [Dicrocoelium dendriticum]
MRSCPRGQTVQNERDKISTRSSLPDSATTSQTLLNLKQLVQAESRAQCAIQDNCCPRPGSESEAQSVLMDGISQMADVKDICDSIKTQLVFLIEWAKSLPSFETLPMSDQIALLQSHAGEMLILGAVWRSLSTARAQQTTRYSCCLTNGDAVKRIQQCQSERPRGICPDIGRIANSSDIFCLAQDANTNQGDQHGLVDTQTSDPQLILLGNRRVISRRSPQMQIAEIARLILDHLYQPMQELCLDDAEMICLRAIVFFDPNCANLTESGRTLVRMCQYQIQIELMHLMNDKLYLPQGRFGALLLLLPELRSVTQQMVNRLQLAKQMGLTRLDELLSEILLCRESNGVSPFPAIPFVHLYLCVFKSVLDRSI